MAYGFERVELGDDAHPNTAVFELSGGGEEVKVRGASVGGGRIEVTDIDGFSVDLGGDHHTLVVVADDRPGTIARVSGLCAQHDVNVATMRVDRTGRRKYALMTIETDEPAPDEAVQALLAEPWLHVIRRVDRIAD